MNGDGHDNEGGDIGKKQKRGNLRVDPQGNATFKHLPTTDLVRSLQLGIHYSVGGLEARAASDVLFHDFLTVEIIYFPKSGGIYPKPTPPHRFNDFTLRTYAPVAFRHFREKFNFQPGDYLATIDKPFRELKNPGASGSLFFLTADDEFIIKTVQKKEAEFLKALLPGYYMNIMQNQRTLLPKFFGLYCYQGDNKNIRITVMNNLIPSDIVMHEKYDLKGSTHKRRANSEERQKEFPTWKDLDFMERHAEGLFLDADTYNALQKTVDGDCRVLESFQIMDYSFLIGVHRIDTFLESSGEFSTPIDPTSPKPKRMMYSTPMDTIQAKFNEFNKPDDRLAKTGGIPARTANGQRLALYVGIIDILQLYQLRKKLEHRIKSVMTDATQISVTNPTFYSDRFRKFLFTTVFKKAPQRASRIPLPDSSPYAALSPWTDRGLGPPYAYPNHVKTSPSTLTASSHTTSNYDSLRSSRQSNTRPKDGSSATLNESSQQSDSLYNQPRRKRSARIETTSFKDNQNHYPRSKNHRDLSAGPKKPTDKRQNLSEYQRQKFSKSVADLSSGKHLSEYSSIERQQTYLSSDEITRL